MWAELAFLLTGSFFGASEVRETGAGAGLGASEVRGATEDCRDGGQKLR
jgi:hypothetical protein